MSNFYRMPDGRVFVPASDEQLAMLEDEEDFEFGEPFSIGEDDDDMFGHDMAIGDDVDVFGADDLDVFGDDLLFGADATAIARRPTQAQLMARRKALMQRRAAQLGAMARLGRGFTARPKRPVNKAFKLILPFTQTFLAGATGTIELRPQRDTELQTLAFHSGTASFFRILSITVGQDNVFNASGSFNAGIFAEGAAQNLELKGFTANLGNTVVIQALNLDGANARDLSGIIKGNTIIRVG